MADSHSARTKAFISYNRADDKHRERLRIHLRHYIREQNIDVWDDTRIEVGAFWKDEIKQAIASAKVAILLVSADFLASDFIANDELPPLLDAAKKDGLVIFTIILSASAFQKTSLANYQTFNKPTEPLISLPKDRQEDIWAKLSEKVAATLAAASSPGKEPDVSPKTHEQGLDEKNKPNDIKDEQITSISSSQSSRLKSNQPTKLAQKTEQHNSTPLTQGTILSEYSGHSGYVRLAAWSPDGTRIVSSDGGFSESSDGGIFHVWNVDDGDLLFTYDPHERSAHTSVAWSPDGTRIASGHAMHLTAWNADGSGQLFSYKSDLYPYPAWSPDSTRIASIAEFGDVNVWNADGSGLLYTIEDPIGLFGWYGLFSLDSPRHYTSVAWSPDGTRIASGYGSGTIQVWNASGSGPRFIYESKKTFSLGSWNRPDPHPVDSLTWSPDGTRIASTSHYDELVKVWNADGSGLHFAYKAYKGKTYNGSVDTTRSVVWSPDGTRIAASNREILQVWNADGSGQLFSYKSNNSFFVGPLFWSPDGTHIASVAAYGTILQVWSVAVPVW